MPWTLHHHSGDEQEPRGRIIGTYDGADSDVYDGSEITYRGTVYRVNVAVMVNEEPAYATVFPIQA